MSDGKLVFRRPLDDSGRLVFGDSGGTEVPDVVVSIDADLPGLDGQVDLIAGTVLAGDTLLPDLDADVGLVWDPNVSRGQAVHVGERWEDGRRAAHVAGERWQDAGRLAVGALARWQDGTRRRGAHADRWQDAGRLRGLGGDRWQDADPRRRPIFERWEEATHLREVLAERWQDGGARRRQVVAAWEETTHHRHVVAGRWQDADGRRGAVLDVARHGRPQRARHGERWEDARRPPPGVSHLHPPVEPPHLCYDPETLGRLVFRDPWSGDGRLVFRCWVHGPGPEPGATVVVPICRAYFVLNESTLRRVDGNVILPTYSMSMQIDFGAWGWSLTASLPTQALADLEPASDGTPIVVEAVVNGVAYRFAVDSISRDRVFGSDAISIAARSLAAELASPGSPVLNFGVTNEIGMTAAQLLESVLTFNGVPIGWTVDFQLEDWLIPQGAWTKQSTYIEAVNEIAAAAGGYVQAHRSDKVLHVLPLYPAMPWAWGDVTPDIELPAAAMRREGTEWVEKSRYTGVYVQGSVRAWVKRAGTDGANLAAMVTDPLITHATAARQRGGSILADTGRIANVTLGTAGGILDENDQPIGIIPPGKFVRYVDNGVPRVGITRSVNVEVSDVEVWQSIGVEFHESSL